MHQGLMTYLRWVVFVARLFLHERSIDSCETRALCFIGSWPDLDYNGCPVEQLGQVALPDASRPERIVLKLEKDLREGDFPRGVSWAAAAVSASNQVRGCQATSLVLCSPRSGPPP